MSSRMMTWPIVLNLENVFELLVCTECFPISKMEFPVDLSGNRSQTCDIVYRSILIANNILLLSKEATPDLDPEDVKNIRKLSKRSDVKNRPSNIVFV